MDFQPLKPLQKRLNRSSGPSPVAALDRRIYESVVYLTVALVLSTLARLPIVAGLDGRSHDILKEAHGKPVALVFISHECPICNGYAPQFARLGRTFGKHARIGLVYAERGLTLSAARDHAKAFGLAGLHLYLDPSGRLASACGAKTSPEAVVFDGQGRRTYLGRVDDLYLDFGRQRRTVKHHDLRDAIQSTLMHKAVIPASGPPVGCVIETSFQP